MRLPLAILVCTIAAVQAAPPDGEALYKERCGVCHDGKPQPRMPSHDELAARAPEAVVRAMFEGAMMIQSSGLTQEEGRAIARFITAKEFSASIASNGAISNTVGRCPAAGGAVRLTGASWNGWGKDLDNTRFQPTPGIAAEDVPKLKLKWA